MGLSQDDPQQFKRLQYDLSVSVGVNSGEMDDRPAIEQVKSGFRIVGAFLASFAAMLLFRAGYINITNPNTQRVGLGWVILLATVITMLFTVRFWADWFCGIAGYLAVRSTFLMFFSQKEQVFVWTALGLTASLWLMAILAIQFYRRRKFSYFDQFTVTTAAVCLFWGFARLGRVGYSGMLVSVAIGLPVLPLNASKTQLKHRLQKNS
jgi:hypothetical protein